MFTPPVDTPRSHIPPGTRGIAARLFKYFHAPSAASNVFILTDDTVTSEWPAPDYTDLASPVFPQDRIARAFYGAHGAYPVNAAEQALLEEAGYTVE